jgi:AraC-like DNA-binding protein
MFREPGGQSEQPEGAFGQQLGHAFALNSAPSFVNRDLKAGLLAVTEIRDDDPEFRPTDSLPVEDAYLVTLHLRAFDAGKAWYDNKMWPVRTIFEGATLIRDLKRNPTVLIDQPHHTLHFYVPRAAMDLIAAEAKARRIDDIRHAPGEPIDDPVIRSLGTSILGAFALPAQANRMFLDHILMAVATHASTSYGGLQPGSHTDCRGLAAWQERRAKEIISANLSGEIEVADLAAECAISISHFRRGFRSSTGVAPHQWLLHRRVDLAQALMRESGASLAEIALECGFADQSHFTRVFRRLVNASPGQWRRDRCGTEFGAPDSSDETA